MKKAKQIFYFWKNIQSEGIPSQGNWLGIPG